MEGGQRLRHVDRKELYTDLNVRLDYLHSFLEFGQNDIDALVSGSKYIKELIPFVVDRVYRKLLSFDITAQAFKKGDTSYEDLLDEPVKEDDPPIRRRKIFLRWYLTKLCADPTKIEFWQYLDKVGLMHIGRGRLHPLHVEYVHIGACLSLVQDLFTEALMSHPHLSLDRKVALIRALGKVIWIQNDLFAKWYVKDGAEYADQRIDWEAEKEAASLRSKKTPGDGSTIGSGSEHDGVSICSSAPTNPTNYGDCPFSGASATSFVTKIWAE